MQSISTQTGGGDTQPVNNKRLRDSNLELLRIISMAFIVLGHYVYHGLSSNNPVYAGHEYYTNFLTFGGGFGVNCFILISGYYMIKSHITFRKMALLVGQVLFYSIGIFLFFHYFGSNITTKNIVSSFIPLHYAAYWFVTIYIALILFSPLLNKAIESLSKRQLINAILLLLLVSLWYIPGQTFPWFVTLYIIGSFIRLHIKKSIQLRHFCLTLTGIMFIILIVGCCTLPLLDISDGILSCIANKITKRLVLGNSIFILVLSITVFIYFIHLQLGRNKWINTIAACTLGVYLIHDNNLMRPYLWHELLHTRDMLGSPYFYLHCFGSVAAVYIVCTLIDYCRILTVEKIYIRILDKYIVPLWDKLYNRYLNITSSWFGDKDSD